MKIQNYFLLLFLLGLSFGASAQQNNTFTGCVIYEHDTGNPIYWKPIYTNVSGGSGYCNGYSVTYYSSNTASVDLEDYCYVSGIPNARTFPGAQRFFFGPNPNYRNCSVNGSCGIVNTITVTTCPLDDHLWMMAFLGLPMLLLWVRKHPELMLKKAC